MSNSPGRAVRSQVLVLLALTQVPIIAVIVYIARSPSLVDWDFPFRAITTLALLTTGIVIASWLLADRWLIRRIDRDSIEAKALRERIAEQDIEIHQDVAAQRLLSQAGKELVATLDPERTLDGLTQIAVRELADWCAVDLLPVKSGDTPLRLLSHRDPSKQELLARLSAAYPIDPLNADTPVGDVMRTGHSVVSREITPAMLAKLVPDAERRALAEQLGMYSMMTVPLRVGGRTLGTLTLVSSSPVRRFDDDDQQLAEELARRAAVAVDNARLYEAAQEELRMRARAESELRQLNAELEDRVRQRTAQLEATNRELESFSYSVSHDLRSPLRSIDGFSQALLEDYEATLDERGREYLGRVRRAAQTMGRLIDDLLQLARITRKEMQCDPVNLSSLAEQVVSELQTGDPERQVDVEIAPGLCAVGDPGLLRAALANLLGNAWKFTAKTSHPHIEFGAFQQNGDRGFYVRDNGAGFDMAYAGKLFGAFQRLHQASDFEGTGIGLATVQRVINRHGGRIWAEGAVGQGAVFYFTLS
jgi:signal transduction histidine kinase